MADLARFGVDEEYLYPPGVWLSPFTMSGNPVIVAVDSRGELVARAQVPDEVKPEAIARGLWSVLEAADPAAVDGGRPTLQVLDGGRDG